MQTIGKPVERIDAKEKVVGLAKYPGDYNLPNQLYMKVLFANRPHAIIRSIDVSKAEKVDGVVAVLTAKDVPVNEYGLIMFDQPVLCGPGSDKPFADRVRFVGDQVALVIAETEAIAEQAKELIEVEYEDLPVVSDAKESMGEHAFLLHPDKESNVFCHYRIRKGDIEDGFSKADVIVESEYITPVQEHIFLQPEAGVGYIDDEGRVTVVVGGQWAHEDREQIAHALNLPEERVRVIYPAIGGAFGGREDMSVQIVLALAAWKLHERGIHRPVKIIWSREESIIGHHKRHQFKIRTRWGATKDGKLTAAEVELIEDGGAYAYTSTKVLGNATLMCTGPYEFPNVKVDAYAVYTNNIPGGAFRGFGGPQGLFAAEAQMNKLADALGMDRVEIRMKNLLHEGSLLSVGTPLPEGVSIPQVVEKCALEAGWKKENNRWISPTIRHDVDDAEGHLKRGIGFACGFKNVGFSFGAPESAWATIELFGEKEIEKVIVHHAAAEVGQGTHTAIAQMAAEALGVSMDIIEMVVSDTARTDNSGSVSASRMTFMAGNSIRGAAELALQKWNEGKRPAIGRYQYKAPKTTPYDPETGASEPNFAYGYVSQAVLLDVDTETGHIFVRDVVTVNDVGKAINPQQVEGQIEGAVVQALGYTVLEKFVQVDGKVLTSDMATYLVPGILDIPEQVRSIILEYPDPRGPWGARGMGEMPFLPLAPAIIDAIHDATGVYFDDFPLTPERLLRGLGKIGS